VCCSVLQCVAVCCSMLQCLSDHSEEDEVVMMQVCVLQCVAV